VRPTALYADAEEAAELYAADVAGGHGAAVGAAAVPSVDDFMARLATVNDSTFFFFPCDSTRSTPTGGDTPELGCVSAAVADASGARGAAQAPKATDSEEPDDPTSSAWEEGRDASS
jgi:hypothetical protein